ncbi:elongation factor P hydroxylase [Alteromonas gilva]|uniref:Elongation factor P hydroxylase n=1 Tax=Alteromonas gilva TaxID=2987522 RepID=A0ABT5L0Q8_9ALTE|nr:elongation factor P hydroxylase [Alteromonas gilva]MDC8830629.1 elongation factor P hydroxylase [Alteromonas gilva]
MQYVVAHSAQKVQEQPDPDVAPLMALFDETFYATYNTRLIKGGDEPIYVPASSNTKHDAQPALSSPAASGAAVRDYHQIVFANGYFSSALHEIAHWCIAGDKRRLLEDYGYWYCPDGRDADQQHAFEQVEIKPQALEWAMTIAAGRRFQVSTDNLNGVEPDRAGFTRRVRAQLQQYMEHGFPHRAERFIDALRHQFNGPALTNDWLAREYPNEQ